MKVTVFYTKNSSREARARVSFGEGLPTLENIMSEYVQVWDGYLPELPIDIVFEIFNNMNPRMKNPLADELSQKMIKKLDTHTSMSVGDIVEIDKTAYICEPAGWGLLKVA